MCFWSSAQFPEILIALIVAFVVTIVSIKLLYPFAGQIGLIDHPTERKYHAQKTPLIGGIAMFTGLAFGLVIMPIDLNILKGYFLALMLIVVLGMIDDYHPQSHWLRLFFQLIAGLILIDVSGIQIYSLGNLFGTGDFILGISSVLITIVAVAGAINAINFIDGVDGVAGSVSLVTIVSIIFLSYNSIDSIFVQLALIVLIVLIPFMFFNLRKKSKIFMGDAGSMLLGFSIVIILIGLSQGSEAVFKPITVLWIFALPLIDLLFVMFRRILRGESPFLPDRHHIHYLFLRHGMSDRQALFYVILISSIFAVIGVFSELMAIAEWKMFVLFIVSSILYSLVLLRFDKKS